LIPQWNHLTTCSYQQLGAGAKVEAVTYLHLVLQLLRHADTLQDRQLEDDLFDQGFLDRVAKSQP